jgi:uncharacterized protein YndB with AHSA1/START domain
MVRETLVPLATFLRRRFGSVAAAWPSLHRRLVAERLDRLTAHLMQTRRELQMDDLKVIAPPGETTITLTRTFKAPQTLVWKAMTEREHIVRWWGLKNATVEVLEFDFRIGGGWRFRQSYQGGDKPSMVFYGKYREIAPISKVSNTFGIEGMYGDEGLVETLSLSEKEGVTTYTSVSQFLDVASRDGMVASGMEYGARESMNQLEDLLAELQQH